MAQACRKSPGTSEIISQYHFLWHHWRKVDPSFDCLQNEVPLRQLDSKSLQNFATSHPGIQSGKWKNCCPCWQFAVENNVYFTILTQNLTHMMQPLDMGAGEA